MKDVKLNDQGWQLPDFKQYENFSKKTKYCVVIPIINEGERIKKELAEIQSLGINKQADIILADGGSTDKSTDLEVLKKLGVRSLLVKTGPGKLSAQLRMAYAYALKQGYEGVVTIDGNGKDGVDAIPSFLNALSKGFELVHASRFIPGGKAINTPWSRLVAIRLIHSPILSLAAGSWFSDTTNGFRAYSRKYLLDPRVQPFRDVFSTYELLAYMTVRAPQLKLKTIELPATRAYPKGEIPTKISHWKGNLLLMQIVFRSLLRHYHP